jgi:hypothetical protein
MRYRSFRAVALEGRARSHDSGDIWFGPLEPAPNLVVVGPENGVTPHSGQQMLKGRAPRDGDQDWYNLAYRLNHGSPPTGKQDVLGVITVDSG